MSEPHKARILIAMGLDRRAIVLATDSSWVAQEVDGISAYTDDIGILDADEYNRPCGVYLWVGVLSVDVDRSSGVGEPETVYEGVLAPIAGADLAYLLSMAPPVVCELCGQPMGEEAGDVHLLCADRENMG